MDIISFYSYKGGAGRSVTAFNTLPFLVKKYNATPKNPILIIDMDIDSAGITLLLDKANKFKDVNRVDISDYFSNPKLLTGMQKYSDDYTEHSLLKYSIDVSNELGVEANTVMFLGINQNRISDDFKANKANAKERFELLVRACEKYNFKALVFDSASGNQPIAELILRRANKIIICMKATKQFRYGTFEHIKNMYKIEGFKDNVNLVILPLAIPQNNAMQNSTTSYKTDALERIGSAISDIEKSGVQIEKGFIAADNFGIPEVETFKWEELCLHYEININNRTLLPDEKKAYDQFCNLAQLIVNI